MNLGRRRFLTIMAGCALSATQVKTGFAEPVSWRGRALGAVAEIKLYGPETGRAQQALAAARDTIRRMEHLFSFYQAQSTLNLLNSKGTVRMPPEFARLMRIVDNIHQKSAGLFDPTVQPMMVAMARARSGLTPSERQSLAMRIGWDKVLLQPATISFSKPGMAMTLNGIAQGFATDRVSEVLRAQGFDPYLVHIGEYRAGLHSARIGLSSSKGEILEDIDLKGAALATSAPLGTRFENGHGHIVRPDLTEIEPRWRSVTVKAATAAEADGLSTALALSHSTDLAKSSVVDGMAQAIWLEDRDGALLRI